MEKLVPAILVKDARPDLTVVEQEFVAKCMEKPLATYQAELGKLLAENVAGVGAATIDMLADMTIADRND